MNFYLALIWTKFDYKLVSNTKFNIIYLTMRLFATKIFLNFLQ